MGISFPPALQMLETFAVGNDFGTTVNGMRERTDDFEAALFGRNHEISFAAVRWRGKDRIRPSGFSVC
jgi:hypothetical protein